MRGPLSLRLMEAVTPSASAHTGAANDAHQWCDMQRFTRRVLPAALLATSLLTARESHAQALDSAARTAIVDSVIAQLERLYVFPATAATMGADLRARLVRGEYDAVDDVSAFAARLTEQLQAVSRDRHLRLRAPGTSTPAAGGASPARPTTPFGRTERMEGNVAYIEILTFGMPAGPVRNAVRAVMDSAADASALIIDLRDNGGGRPELVALITSYLFGDEPVHLNSLYWRPRDTTQDFFTNPDVEGRKYGPDKPVFVLTSSRTFSAAEEFSYNLQARERATLVGETTGGGAHPGGGVQLPHGLMMFVPSGRAINPVTGTNWEGTGVVPDVAARAEDALDVALGLARK